MRLSKLEAARGASIEHPKGTRRAGAVPQINRRKCANGDGHAGTRRESVCAKSAHCTLFAVPSVAAAIRRSPTSPKVPELHHMRTGSGVAEWRWTHQIRRTPQMPDVQVSPSPETRDYLNIAETARSFAPRRENDL